MNNELPIEKVVDVSMYDSGNLVPLSGPRNRALPCAAEIVGDVLVLVGPDLRPDGAYPRMYYSTFAIGDDFTDQLSETSNWTPTELTFPSWQQAGDVDYPSALSACGAAVLTAALWFVWAEADYQEGQVGWRLMAATYDVVAQDWGAAVQLCDQDGVPVTSEQLDGQAFDCGKYGDDANSWYAPDVCVRAVDNETALVGLTWRSDSGDQTYFYLYAPGNATPEGLDATAGITLPTTYLFPASSSSAAAQHRFLSFDWAFVDPSNSCLVTSSFDESAQQMAVAVFPLTLYSQAQTTGAGSPDTLTLGAAVAATANAGTWGGSVRRDFFGQPLCWWWQTSSTLGGLRPVVTGEGDEMAVAWPAPQFAAPAGLASDNPSNDGVCTLDLVGPTATSITQTVPGANGQSETLPAVIYPVYRFWFSCGYPLYLRVQQICWAQKVPQIPLGSPVTPDDSPRYVLTGIVDGPVPAQNDNLTLQIAGKLNFDNGFATVAYGSRQTDATTYTASKTVARGLHVSESVSVWGVGEGAVADFSWGSATTSAATEEDSVEANQYLTADIVVDPQNTDQYQPAYVDPWGAGFCTDVALYADHFSVVTENNGAWTVDATMPSALVVRPAFTTGVTLNYFPYMVSPGDLSSYTEAEINDRMAALGFGDDYVDAVIRANAYTFPDGNNCLTFTWARGSGTNGTFQDLTESFVEHSWSFNGSVYAGLSGKFSVSASPTPTALVSFQVFNLEYEVMGGTNWSTYHSSASKTTQAWSVGVSNVGLLSQGIGTAQPQPGLSPVSSYRVSMYFLPASQRWTTELLAALNNGEAPQPSLPFTDKGLVQANEIDPNSAPWKIVFVVDEIIPMDS